MHGHLDALDRLSEDHGVLVTGDMMRILDTADVERQLIVDQPIFLSPRETSAIAELAHEGEIITLQCPDRCFRLSNIAGVSSRVTVPVIISRGSTVPLSRAASDAS